jgi:hypothetical protein
VNHATRNLTLFGASPNYDSVIFGGTITNQPEAAHPANTLTRADTPSSTRNTLTDASLSALQQSLKSEAELRFTSLYEPQIANLNSELLRYKETTDKELRRMSTELVSRSPPPASRPGSSASSARSYTGPGANTLPAQAQPRRLSQLSNPHAPKSQPPQAQTEPSPHGRSSPLTLTTSRTSQALETIEQSPQTPTIVSDPHSSSQEENESSDDSEHSSPEPRLDDSPPATHVAEPYRSVSPSPSNMTNSSRDNRRARPSSTTDDSDSNITSWMDYLHHQSRSMAHPSSKPKKDKDDASHILNKYVIDKTSTSKFIKRLNNEIIRHFERVRSHRK